MTVTDRSQYFRPLFLSFQSRSSTFINTHAPRGNRPLLVLDKWAADQDPHFRRYFYEQLLPKLRKQGKTVIAVTHDDAYFKHADRLMKFEYERIVKDMQLSSTAEEIL
ncbi:hypothetical protein [Chitinophaga oryzae]|uniref:hypothetical protein n=1 Tax=Chitinophaga oryzae TaxID=2725414 RepID=UPI001C65A726|nr:hypothetical protein [Chitinophaga oryzae]